MTSKTLHIIYDVDGEGEWWMVRRKVATRHVWKCCSRCITMPAHVSRVYRFDSARNSILASRSPHFLPFVSCWLLPSFIDVILVGGFAEGIPPRVRAEAEQQSCQSSSRFHFGSDYLRWKFYEHHKSPRNIIFAASIPPPHRCQYPTWCRTKHCWMRHIRVVEVCAVIAIQMSWLLDDDKLVATFSIVINQKRHYIASLG